MCKSTLFEDILSVVSNVTEIGRDRILSECKEMEVADARSLLVKFLSDAGMYPKCIASLINRSAAGVRYILSEYDSRRAANKMIVRYEYDIRKQLESNS